jgi:hypothetical protein
VSANTKNERDKSPHTYVRSAAGCVYGITEIENGNGNGS